ncbi:hypothetical protein WICMUC_000552 [Wickerhamomyces mucosus]|uniref:RhoGAP-domain-containing protein n=1 Tax=Wickerhamomyces mucosus TaxID=1378264 RepID=A0A9P8PZF2_9ASCO|nr:hypothetical protein WICMUC_000552 [Wickerhamomyces mucosus]
MSVIQDSSISTQIKPHSKEDIRLEIEEDEKHHENHNHNHDHDNDDNNDDNHHNHPHQPQAEEDSQTCRRCDLSISEGHAYELGGDRWHMYCFSCSKCSKLLGASSNFLVLGTGDLICSECSYNCNSCGKKIDDLAILTGEQAYCSNCFCCRSCKKRIEDLRYARTSKGLFCMSCHEKLLEKKRRYELEKKKLKRMSKFAIDKSLPKVPTNEPSPASDVEVSSAEFADPATVTKVEPKNSKINEIPPRSPNRVPAQLAPIELEPPVSVTPKKQLSPEEQFFHSPNRNKSPIRTPNGKNRQAIVLESISSSPSNNILSDYLNSTNDDDIGSNLEYLNEFNRRSPAPSIPLPKLSPPIINHSTTSAGNDDFIDMNDSDDKENNNDINATHEKQFNDDEKENQYTKRIMGFSENRQTEFTGNGLNISLPMSPSPIKENEVSISRSRSIRSPKAFLNFRKHKKTSSQNSIDLKKISSPLIDESSHLSTPKPLEKKSPIVDSGGSVFRTPPIPETQFFPSVNTNQRRVSSHSRSRSDINGIENLESNNLELEMRALKLEILDLKQTKQFLSREIRDLKDTKEALISEIQNYKNDIEFFKQPQPQGIKKDAGLQDYSTEERRYAQNIPEERKKDSKKFWKRGLFQNKDASPQNNLSNSQSSYSLSNILSSNGNTEERLNISAPILKTDESDELGGNDNRKLTGPKYLEVNPKNNSSNITNNGPGGNNNISTNTNIGNNINGTITTKHNNGSSGQVSNSSLFMSDLFNSTLEMRAQYEKRDVPIIVSRLIQEIEKNGLDHEGIYRKNGSTSQMNNILKAFNGLYQNETSFELENILQNCDINALTSSLKRYLYFHLPEAIIINSYYNQFIQISQLNSQDSKITSLAQIIKGLPVTNQKVLRLLLLHLSRIESLKNENKMTYHNLSVVFGSSFLRINDNEKELQDMEKKNSATEFLLVYHQDVFRKIRDIA